MFNITLKLKQYMTANHGVAADATDEVVNKAISEALLEGKLEISKVKELTKADAEDASAKVKSMIADEVKAANASLLGDIAKLVGAKGTDGSDAGAKAYNAGIAAQADGEGKPTDHQIRVKSALERYSDSRSTITWSKSSNDFLSKSFGSKPVDAHFAGQPYAAETPSERMKAVAGVYFKHRCLAAMKQAGQHIPDHYQMKSHEKDLLEAVVYECRFMGDVKGHEYEGEKITSDLHRKAILDDSTSGGLEAVPIEFDAAVILTPLLHGELFPLVDVKTVSRRRIEAAKVGNPTLMWGVGSGTAISLFDTDSFISAFDNNIHVLSGAMEIGEDFLSDSPLSIGEIVIRNYGERHKQELDNVIATGNGTNQPEGLFTASGVTTNTPVGGAGTDPQVGDYEGLMFGVAKEYRNEAGKRAVFIGTDTSYSRSRGIPVGASDARRVFGLSEEDYMLLGHKYAVNGSLTNAKIGYFCMNRYRMYRRMGMEIVWVSGNTDFQLARENKRGLVIRSRWGGALEQAGAGCKQTAAKA